MNITSSARKSILIGQIKELQELVREEYKIAHEPYKKGYYEDQTKSILRRKINNAKQAMKNLDEKIDSHDIRIYENKIKICHKMIDCSNIINSLLQKRNSKPKYRKELKEAITQYKKLKNEYKKLRVQKKKKAIK